MEEFQKIIEVLSQTYVTFKTNSVYSLLGIGFATTVISIGGVRIGPGRALVLGLKSLIFSPPTPMSVRKSIVKNIRSEVFNMHRDNFLIVYGTIGIGKTVAVSTAMRNLVGVVQIDVDAGDSKERIMKKSLEAISNAMYTFLQSNYSAPREKEELERNDILYLLQKR
jgi:hypothetical protein